MLIPVKYIDATYRQWFQFIDGTNIKLDRYCFMYDADGNTVLVESSESRYNDGQCTIDVTRLSAVNVSGDKPVVVNLRNTQLYIKS